MIANNPNFAVASKSDASLDPVRDVRKRYQEAFEKWHKLYADPQVWTDPEKRAAMIRARLGYQDITLEWVQAWRKTV